MDDITIDDALKVLLSSPTGKQLLNHVIDKARKLDGNNAQIRAQLQRPAAAPNDPTSQLGGPTIPENPIKGTVYDNPPPPKITQVNKK